MHDTLTKTLIGTPLSRRVWRIGPYCSGLNPLGRVSDSKWFCGSIGYGRELRLRTSPSRNRIIVAAWWPSEGDSKRRKDIPLMPGIGKDVHLNAVLSKPKRRAREMPVTTTRAVERCRHPVNDNILRHGVDVPFFLPSTILSACK